MTRYLPRLAMNSAVFQRFAFGSAITFSQTAPRALFWSATNCGIHQNKRFKGISSPTSNSWGTCSCGCNGLHTKGDKELVQFLTEEIDNEKKSQASPKLPKIEGFDIKTDSSSITLTKKIDNEVVTVNLNVNHTVDAEVSDSEIDPNVDKPEAPEMKSKPNFSVEISKGGKILAFNCSFQQEYEPEVQSDPDAFNDLFSIDELAVYEGERTDLTYAVAGEIMDGYLYDLLMNLLEERGISNQFAEKLMEFSTSYEHKLYIGLLERLKSFASS
jgi:complement component 1 Q subcomponent-binding protein